MFSTLIVILSCWYKRSEFGIRAAIFFSAAAVAGSFGGLLAAAIGKMDGVGGKPGWAWIFILEGLATFLIGLISFWMVQDFPDDAKFLSDAERRLVIRRLKQDKQSSAEHEEFKMKYFKLALTDYKTYVGMIIYMGCDTAVSWSRVRVQSSSLTLTSYMLSLYSCQPLSPSSAIARPGLSF